MEAREFILLRFFFVRVRRPKFETINPGRETGMNTR